MVCLRRVGLNRATLGSYVTDIPRVASRACQGGGRATGVYVNVEDDGDGCANDAPY